MVDGRAPMQLDFKAKTNQGTIHTLILIIQVGETIQTSSRGSPNNPNNKEALGSNPRASTPSHTPPIKSNNNLPKILDNDTLLKLLTNLSQGQENQAKAMQNQDKRVDHLEKQIGQIADFVGKFRDQGQLPTSSTIPNPKGGFETAKAILLRSGKEVGAGSQPSTSGHKEDERLQFEEEKQSQPTARVETPLPQVPCAPKPSNLSNKGKIVSNSIPTNVIPPNVPFPSRFMQASNEANEKDVLETFRKVQVNIPLLDAIKQIPKYAKFLKKLCTTRKRIQAKEVVHVSENVSAMLQRKLPPKCKDPGSFTIPCVIGNNRFENVMLDLGASINVMPYSIYASMNLGKLKNDGVIIQLADRSNAYPKGVLEDVLVQVEHLIFPADFYVLDMEDSAQSPSSPILLGRPFMKTAQTKIDVAKGVVTMAFGGDMINFNISESIEHTNDVRSCFVIDVIKTKGQEHSTLPRTTIKEGISVDHVDQAPTPKAPNLAESNTLAVTLASSSQNNGKPLPLNPIPISTNRLLPSLVQVPNLVQDGGNHYIDFRELNATIRKDHYPLPFLEQRRDVFRRAGRGGRPIHAVGSNGE